MYSTCDLETITMTDLTNQLMQLQGLLQTIRQQYSMAVAENHELKTHPEDIEQALIHAEEQNALLQQQLDEQIKKYQELDERYLELSNSNDILKAECDKLNEENQKLIDKNKIAAHYTELVLARLTKIDNES